MRHNTLSLVVSKSRKAAKPENALQKTVTDFLRRAMPEDSYWNVIPAGNGRVTTAIGYEAGAPDLFIVYRSRCHFIELKSAKGSVSQEQKDAHKRLAWAGADTLIARTPEQVEEWLLSKRIPLKASFSA